MGRIFILLSVLISAGFVHAGQVSMYENGYPINVMPIQSVIIDQNTPEAEMKITILSFIRPCANYPKNVDGDIYGCSTTSTEIAKYLKNDNLLLMNEQDLKSWFLSSNVLISCNTQTKPELVRYSGKSVYLFLGPLFTPKQ